MPSPSRWSNPSPERHVSIAASSCAADEWRDDPTADGRLGGYQLDLDDVARIANSDVCSPYTWGLAIDARHTTDHCDGDAAPPTTVGSPPPGGGGPPPDPAD